VVEGASRPVIPQGFTSTLAPTIFKMKTKRQLEKEAEKKFLKQLDKLVDLAYIAGIENRGDVLTMPIKELYSHLTKP